MTSARRRELVPARLRSFPRLFPSLEPGRKRYGKEDAGRVCARDGELRASQGFDGEASWKGETTRRGAGRGSPVHGDQTVRPLRFERRRSDSPAPRLPDGSHADRRQSPRPGRRARGTARAEGGCGIRGCGRGGPPAPEAPPAKERPVPHDPGDAGEESRAASRDPTLAALRDVPPYRRGGEGEA